MEKTQRRWQSQDSFFHYDQTEDLQKCKIRRPYQFIVPKKENEDFNVDIDVDVLERFETPETSLDDIDDIEKETSEATTPTNYLSSRKGSESRSKSKHTYNKDQMVIPTCTIRTATSLESSVFNQLEEALDDLYERISEIEESYGSMPLKMPDVSYDDSSEVTGIYQNQHYRSFQATHPPIPESSSPRLGWLDREEFHDFFPHLDFDTTTAYE